MGSASELSQTMKNAMLIYLPTFMAGVVAFQPAALQVSFLTAMVWGATQGYLFKRVWFRNLFKMAQFPVKTDQISHQSRKLGNSTKVIDHTKPAPRGSSKLRTVVAPPLRYEPPRERAQREMAAFQPPKIIATKASRTPEPTDKGLFQSVKEDFTKGPGKLLAFAEKSSGVSMTDKPGAARKNRAEEYEIRRKREKRDEADMRRQGNN